MATALVAMLKLGLSEVKLESFNSSASLLCTHLFGTGRKILEVSCTAIHLLVKEWLALVRYEQSWHLPPPPPPLLELSYCGKARKQIRKVTCLISQLAVSLASCALAKVRIVECERAHS